MKVFLLKTPEYNEEGFIDVHRLLETFEGPIEFIKVDVEFDAEKFPFLKKFYPDFKFKYPSDSTKILFDNTYDVPLSWKELFSLCDYYRETFKIEKNDFVVLLTERRNALNWFSADNNERSFFVHVNEWETYTNSNPKYPIAYQIVENILQILMKSDITNPENAHIHKKPLGCMNDMCNNKEDVILKLQTANICDACLTKIHDENVDEDILHQAFMIFEGVRNELIYKKRLNPKSKVKQYPVSVTKDDKIMIYDLNKEIRLTPLYKALYLFYLSRTEGVLFKDLVDHQSEILSIYKRLSISDDLSEIEERIKILVNPLENSFNIAKSKINKSIADLLGEPLSKFYKIDGNRGKPFKINISRSLVQYKQ